MKTEDTNIHLQNCDNFIWLFSYMVVSYMVFDALNYIKNCLETKII